jgi:NADH-quinone oxidoreductase subunit H
MPPALSPPAFRPHEPPMSVLIVPLVKILVVANALMAGVAIMTYVERRVSGIIQFRLGPNRVGPFGLFQPLADGIKFLMKEDIVPAEAHKPIFILAPALALTTALCAFAVIPFGPTIWLPLGSSTLAIDLVIVDLDGGLLFALAATALGVYGIVCAGWASRSKYALMGGLRSSAQMVSYELALGLSIVGVLLVSGTLRPTVIVAQQAGWFWNWNVFAGWQPLGFLLFLVAAYAETNRLPFDLPEAESELVAGYHTEYSSMKFSMFFMAEYIAMITAASLAVTLFLGGYQLPFPPELAGLEPGPLLWALQVATFLAKVAFFLFLFVWVRWTLPRFRYDQLMDLGWKRLFPLALANIGVTATLVALDVIRPR